MSGFWSVLLCFFVADPVQNPWPTVDGAMVVVVVVCVCVCVGGGTGRIFCTIHLCYIWMWVNLGNTVLQHLAGDQAPLR